METENSDTKTRFFKAFADLAILSALKNQPMTGYGINKYFMKKVGHIVSPSTIYAHLIRLESRDLIKSVRNRKPRLYALTKEGKKTAEDMPNIVQEIKLFLDKILVA